MGSAGVSNDSYRGEISFIQLAAILVRRKVFFISVFLVFSLSSVVFVYLKTPVYEYLTYYVLPDTGDVKIRSIEADTLRSKVELGFWPDIKEKLMDKYPEGIPFTFSISSDPAAGKLKLLSTAQADRSDEVVRVHELLVDRLKVSVNDSVSSYREGIEEEIASVKATIRDLQEVGGLQEALARAQERSYELSDRLMMLNEGQVIVVAQRGDVPVSVGKRMLAVSLGIVSFIVAVFSTYLLEFLMLVRNAVKEGEAG